MSRDCCSRCWSEHGISWCEDLEAHGNLPLSQVNGEPTHLNYNYIRQPVRTFAATIEHTLRKHDDVKPAWEKQPLVDVIRHWKQECRELEDAIDDLIMATIERETELGMGSSYPEVTADDINRLRQRVNEEAGDVGAITMMIADKITDPNSQRVRGLDAPATDDD